VGRLRMDPADANAGVAAGASMSDEGAKIDGVIAVGTSGAGASSGGRASRSDQRDRPLVRHRVRLLTAMLFAFGPCAYLYANSRHSLGAGATFELLAVCWPFEVAALFVALGCVRD
jgi:hypothetical protein